MLGWGGILETVVIVRCQGESERKQGGWCGNGWGAGNWLWGFAKRS